LWSRAAAESIAYLSLLSNACERNSSESWAELNLKSTAAKSLRVNHLVAPTNRYRSGLTFLNCDFDNRSTLLAPAKQSLDSSLSLELLQGCSLAVIGVSEPS
jgi:hypothetical protein